MFATLCSVAWPSIAAAQEHAHEAAAGAVPSAFEFFDQTSAADIAAIAGQIIPSTDGPGAAEAGVVFFIDRALTTFDKDKQDAYRKGIADLRAIARKMFPKSATIAALSDEQQLKFVRAIEKSEFFEVIRVHTVLGFLGSPAYGGNRGKAGWRHIGFEDRMSWAPPFGYYDAETK